MKTADEYRKMAYESIENQKWIADLEREIQRASNAGMLFYQTLKWGCLWINNPLNIEYLRDKGFEVEIYSPKTGQEWVIVRWKNTKQDLK